MSFAHHFKTFRSSTFRLALVYMGLFLVSVLLLLGFIYWFTARYMVRQTDATIETEISGLAERYTVGGLSGLHDLLAERLARRPAGSAIYLLTGPRYVPLVGNLDHWPRTTPTKDGWLNFRLNGQHWRIDATQIVPTDNARASVRLQQGIALLVRSPSGSIIEIDSIRLRRQPTR